MIFDLSSVRRRRPGCQTGGPPHILVEGPHGAGAESDEVRCFEKQRQEHKLGIMLVAVSVMFIVCQSFKMIPDLYEILFCSDKSVPCITTPFVKTCLNLSHLLVRDWADSIKLISLVIFFINFTQYLIEVIHVEENKQVVTLESSKCLKFSFGVIFFIREALLTPVNSTRMGSMITLCYVEGL